jgi:hypothetical protein
MSRRHLSTANTAKKHQEEANAQCLRIRFLEIGPHSLGNSLGGYNGRRSVAQIVRLRLHSVNAQSAANDCLLGDLPAVQVLAASASHAGAAPDFPEIRNWPDLSLAQTALIRSPRLRE